MKILIIADLPVSPSAYGQQMAIFIPMMRTLGHEVALVAPGVYTGGPLRLSDGTLVLPCWNDPYANDVIVAHADSFGADLVLTLCDPHIFDPAVFQNLPWVSWAPIDSDPPRGTALEALRAARAIWYMAPFVKPHLEQLGKPLHYVPHGINTGVFCPGDRITARAELGKRVGRPLEDSFVAVAVAANHSNLSRKGFFELLSGFKLFSDARPDALLYVHTEVTGGRRGENLHAIMNLIGLDPRKVLFPPQYQYNAGLFRPKHLATTYRAADVYVSASHGEGFGITIIEAKACGCPVIVADNSAQSDLTEPAERVASVPYLAGYGIWKRPSVEALAAALEARYANRARPEPQTTFDAASVFANYMKPALEAALVRTQR